MKTRKEQILAALFAVVLGAGLLVLGIYNHNRNHNQRVKNLQLRRNTTFTKQFQSKPDQLQTGEAKFNSALKLEHGDREQMRGGSIQAILDRYGGNDVRSAFAVSAMLDPRRVVGLLGEIRLDREEFLDAQGRLDVTKFGPMLESFRKQMDHTEEGKALLAELGTGSFRELSDQEIGKAFDQLTRPLSRERLFRDFTVIQGQSKLGRLFMFQTEKDTDRAQEFGTFGMAVVTLGKTLESAHVPGADNMQIIGAEIAQGYHAYFLKDGHIGYTNEALTPEQRAAAKSRFLNTALDSSLLMDKLTPNQISVFAHQSRELGQHMADNLERMEMTLSDDDSIEAAIKKIKIKDRLEALSTAGIELSDNGAQGTE